MGLDMAMPIAISVSDRNLTVNTSSHTRIGDEHINLAKITGNLLDRPLNRGRVRHCNCKLEPSLEIDVLTVHPIRGCSDAVRLRKTLGSLDGCIVTLSNER